MLVNPTL